MGGFRKPRNQPKEASTQSLCLRTGKSDGAYESSWCVLGVGVGLRLGLQCLKKGKDTLGLAVGTTEKYTKVVTFLFFGSSLRAQMLLTRFTLGEGL